MTEKNAQFDEALLKLFKGYAACQLIHAATQLGIADMLAHGPESAEGLALASGSHLPSLARLLRALSALGLLASGVDGYTLTPFGERLWRDPAGAPWALYLEGDVLSAWQGLAESVRDGRAAFEHVHGSPFYEHSAKHPSSAARLNTWMAQSAQRWLSSFARSHDFNGIGTIVDVGGGRGHLVADILRANLAMRGVLVDLPHVVADAPALLQEAGVADRCEVVAGDAFASVPENGDAYLISRVLFNWNDERAVALLSSCRRSMRSSGKLIVIDGMMPLGGGAVSTAFGDLFLAVQFGSMLRTEDEFRRLFVAAGFDLARTTLLEAKSEATSSEFRFYVIEGTPT